MSTQKQGSVKGHYGAAIKFSLEQHVDLWYCVDNFQCQQNWAYLLSTYAKQADGQTADLDNSFCWFNRRCTIIKAVWMDQLTI